MFSAMMQTVCIVAENIKIKSESAMYRYLRLVKVAGNQQRKSKFAKSRSQSSVKVAGNQQEK